MSGNLKICCQSEPRKTQIQLNKNENLFSSKNHIKTKNEDETSFNSKITKE